MRLDIELQGFKELDSALGKLPYEVGTKVLQNAVSSAILPAFHAVKQAAPIGPDLNRSPDSRAAQIKMKYGKLRDNIKKRRSRNYSDKTKSAYISTGNAFWGFFLERGTKYIPANRWFSKAFEGSKDAMLEKLKKDLARGIDKQFKRLTK